MAPQQSHKQTIIEEKKHGNSVWHHCFWGMLHWSVSAVNVLWEAAADMCIKKYMITLLSRIIYHFCFLWTIIESGDTCNANIHYVRGLIRQKIYQTVFLFWHTRTLLVQKWKHHTIKKTNLLKLLNKYEI